MQSANSSFLLFLARAVGFSMNGPDELGRSDRPKAPSNLSHWFLSERPGCVGPFGPSEGTKQSQPSIFNPTAPAFSLLNGENAKKGGVDCFLMTVRFGIYGIASTECVKTRTRVRSSDQHRTVHVRCAVRTICSTQFNLGRQFKIAGLR